MTSAGLNSLRQKEYQISVKNWVFYVPFHKNGLLLVIYVLRMIKPSESVDFLIKWVRWGHWGHWGCKGFKGWKITTEDFSVIQAIDFSFISILKKVFWVESWNIILNFSNFSVGGCWGQLVSFFWKLVDDPLCSKIVNVQSVSAMKVARKWKCLSFSGEGNVTSCDLCQQ